MASYDDKATAFFKAISEASGKRCKEIVRQANALQKKETEAAKREARRRSTDYLKKESDRIRFETGRSVAATQRELKLGLIETRRRITDGVFSEVRDRLDAFTRSPQYEEFLVLTACEMAKYFNGGEIKYYLRAEDIRFSDKISAQVTQSCVFEADDKIKIGGCRALSESSRLTIDDTLDNRLAEQLEWFRENSGLTL